LECQQVKTANPNHVQYLEHKLLSIALATTFLISIQ
jgi:hypothetical protein